MPKSPKKKNARKNSMMVRDWQMHGDIAMMPPTWQHVARGDTFHRDVAERLARVKRSARKSPPRSKSQKRVRFMV